MLLNSMQFTRQALTKNYAAQNANSAEVKNPWVRHLRKCWRFKIFTEEDGSSLRNHGILALKHCVQWR